MPWSAIVSETTMRTQLFDGESRIRDSMRQNVPRSWGRPSAVTASGQLAPSPGPAALLQGRVTEWRLDVNGPGADLVGEDRSGGHYKKSSWPASSQVSLAPVGSSAARL